MCERVLLELNPSTSYTFPSYHAAIKAPFDYFAFGQRYIRCAALRVLRLVLGGATCSGCAWLVDPAVRALPWNSLMAPLYPNSLLHCTLWPSLDVQRPDRLPELGAGPRRPL